LIKLAKPSRHAVRLLVGSAPRRTGRHHAGHQAYGVLKQVQHDDF